jgi:hypothetical protein
MTNKANMRRQTCDIGRRLEEHPYFKPNVCFWRAPAGTEAPGDARSGSVKRVGGAIGEGAADEIDLLDRRQRRGAAHGDKNGCRVIHPTSRDFIGKKDVTELLRLLLGPKAFGHMWP